MGINIRPHIIPALEQIKKDFNMIIYTASHQSYADKVVDLIDPMKSLFKYRLYRHNCVEVPRPDMPNSTLYIKDLRIIKNIPLEDMVIIDNSVLSFAFHLDNGITILPFYSNKEDNEMLNLKDYLSYIYKLDGNSLTINNANSMNLKGLMEEAVKKAEEEDSEETETNDTSKNTSTTSTPITTKKENNGNSNINLNSTSNNNINSTSNSSKMESKKLNKVVSSNGGKNSDNKKISNVKNGGTTTTSSTTTKDKKTTTTNTNGDGDKEKSLKAPTRRKSNIGSLIKQTIAYKK